MSALPEIGGLPENVPDPVTQVLATRRLGDDWCRCWHGRGEPDFRRSPLQICSHVGSGDRSLYPSEWVAKKRGRLSGKTNQFENQ